MGYREKKVIVNIFSGWIILIVYGLYVYQNYPERIFADPVDFKFWASAFLIMIPVSIVARIIVHIVFAIFNKIATDEDPEMKEDERDKLIELKSERVSHWLFILGLLLAMGSLLMDYPPYTMFIVLVIGGAISETIGGIAALYFYRRGV